MYSIYKSNSKSQLFVDVIYAIFIVPPTVMFLYTLIDNCSEADDYLIIGIVLLVVLFVLHSVIGRFRKIAVVDPASRQIRISRFYIPHIYSLYDLTYYEKISHSSPYIGWGKPYFIKREPNVFLDGTEHILCRIETADGKVLFRGMEDLVNLDRLISDVKRYGHTKKTVVD